MDHTISNLRTEAPSPRAREIDLVLHSLHLPSHRLSRHDLERVALAVASRPALYRDLIVDDEDGRWWLLLLATPSFEVRLLTWEHDQSSFWHDHGGSSGVFAVTQGTLRERSRARDHVGVETREFAAGEFGSFGPEHVHEVEHISGHPAVSIHAYSPPLTGLTYYERSDFGFVAREFVPEEDRGARRSTAVDEAHAVE